MALFIYKYFLLPVYLQLWLHCPRWIWTHFLQEGTHKITAPAEHPATVLNSDVILWPMDHIWNIQNQDSCRFLNTLEKGILISCWSMQTSLLFLQSCPLWYFQCGVWSHQDPVLPQLQAWWSGQPLLIPAGAHGKLYWKKRRQSILYQWLSSLLTAWSKTCWRSVESSALHKNLSSHCLQCLMTISVLPQTQDRRSNAINPL